MDASTACTTTANAARPAFSAATTPVCSRNAPRSTFLEHDTALHGAFYTLLCRLNHATCTSSAIPNCLHHCSVPGPCLGGLRGRITSRCSGRSRYRFSQFANVNTSNRGDSHHYFDTKRSARPSGNPTVWNCIASFFASSRRRWYWSPQAG